MSLFHPRSMLDRLFEIGIVLKGLDGLGELIGGLFVLFIRPATVSRWVTILTRGELTEDPHDFIATHLVAMANKLDSQSLMFVAIYLLAHGAIKVVLVLAILRNKFWAYPWMILALLAFIGYQVYELIIDPRISLLALTIFDVVVTALTWREWRVQRRLRGGVGAGRSGQQ